MCVDEVEGEVVVNLLQGEIRIEDGWRDFGLPNTAKPRYNEIKEEAI